MKERSQESVKKATTRWIVTGVALAIYICLITMIGSSMRFWVRSIVGNDNPMLIYLSGVLSGNRSDSEILGVDMTKLGDPEEIERNVRDHLDTYREELQLRIEGTQADIDRMKSEKEGTP